MKHLFLFLPLFAMAAPQGLQVISGNVSHEDNQICATEPSVLHWDSYSIAPDEHIHYPSPHATLNRVVGSDISEIRGHLTSNGPLWLINSNGIVIGESGRINAASFLASTLDQVDNLFTGTRGRIEQRGVIECPGGYVVLMAAEGVVQEGKISAAKVAIGAGREIEFSSDLFRVNSNFAKAAIQCKGLIEATAFEERGSEVYLIADGLCEVEDTEIKADIAHVLGEHVALLGKTTIDTNAGTILIGGDYRGSNPEVKNAKTTFVGKEVLLKADAREKGDGGKVIVWGDEATQFLGRISARGGNCGGNGGLVEVSGKFLEYKGLADLRATQGKFGTLLLDPDDVTISGGATTGGVDLTTDPATLPDMATVTINATDLTNQLQLSNVTIDNTMTSGGGSGTISITSPIGNGGTWNVNTTLKLIAHRDILITANIINTNSTSFDAIDFTANGIPDDNYNGIFVNNVAIQTDGGNITMEGLGGTMAGGSTGAGISINSASGRIESVNGNISLTGTSRINGAPGLFFTSSGSAGTTGSGNVTLNGTASLTTGVLFQISSFVDTVSGQIEITGESSSSDGIRFNTTNVIRSMMGDILIHGISTSAATNVYGFVSAFSTSTGTTGQVKFSNCHGGTGAGGHGISILADFTTGGDFIAIDSILSSTGSFSNGFYGEANITAGGDIEILATSLATGSLSSHGISYIDATMNSSGNISLIGIGPTSNSGSCHGVNLTGLVTTSGTGTIKIAGNARGTGTGVGVSVSTNPNRITSTGGGAIQVSGVSTATGSSSHGVSWTSSWTTSTAGAVTFGAPITIDATTITGCQGGTGGTSHGINAGAAFTTSGSVTATNSILSGTGTGSHGFNGTANITASGNISILATSQATSSTASHGINYTGNVTMSSPGDITLIGVGPTGNSGSSNGVNLTGLVTTSGSGTIKVAGNAQGTGTGVGVLASSSTNRITSSGGGAIQVSGVSTATGSSSHGISWTSSWTTSTAGAVTFGAPITIDATTITGCQGGTGGTSHGINVGATFTTSGSVTATNSIVGGTGTGSHGFSSGSTFNASGNPVAITASTTAGGSTASHGINLTSGTMSGSSITLNGTTSASNTGASNGINLAGGALSSSSGTVSLTGTAVATAGSSSQGILLSSSNPLTSSGNSAITLNGTSHATGSSCHGVSITSSAWVTGSTADLDITGVADGGGATTFPINLGGSTTHSGNINFNDAVGLSANTSVIGNGDASKTILFTDTVNATTAGGQSLTLTTGAVNVGGSVSINGNIGFGTNGRLNLFTMTGGNLLLNANIKAFQGTINAPITVSGDFDLTATAID